MGVQFLGAFSNFS